MLLGNNGSAVHRPGYPPSSWKANVTHCACAFRVVSAKIPLVAAIYIAVLFPKQMAPLVVVTTRPPNMCQLRIRKPASTTCGTSSKRPAVPLCVPAQPSGSSGATSSLQAAGASVSQAATATSEGTLDFTTCLELLVEAFSIPFASGIKHDSAIDAFEAYVNLGAYVSGFRQRLPLWYFQRTEQFSCILRFLNAVMQLQFAAATWTCFASVKMFARDCIQTLETQLNRSNHFVIGNLSGGEVWVHPALHPGASVSAVRFRPRTGRFLSTG